MAKNEWGLKVEKVYKGGKNCIIKIVYGGLKCRDMKMSHHTIFTGKAPAFTHINFNNMN